jgi:hypothetical protein
MPAYAYPINIDRNNKEIQYTDRYELDNDSLVISDLSSIVGNDRFSIDSEELLDGYVVTVYRSKLESDEVRDKRVAKEVRYMEEYTRRKAISDKIPKEKYEPFKKRVK